MERAKPAGRPARRVVFVLLGVLALAALAGGGLYLGRGARPGPGPQAAGRPAASAQAVAAGCGTAAAGSCPGSAADVALAGSPVVVTDPPGRPGTGTHPARSTSPSASASARGGLSGSPSPDATAPATGTAGTTASAPVAPSASPSAPTAADSAAATAVLTLINQARASAGLPALTVTAGLETSSAKHNLLMASGCGLSHQCAGEPAIGDRETAAGVIWTAAGENIGEGGPVADTSAATAQMAVGLTQSMLDEQPPNDGHRMNILSSTFTHIGIAVYRDSAGTVWLTQDFSN
jgi:uncharacterized protein YkwD